MEWNAFNIIPVAMEKTKQRLFPFDFKEWLKLAVISALSGVSSGSSGFRGYNIGSNDLKGTSTKAITEKIKAYWWVGGILFSIMLVLMTVLMYIRSVFAFIFVEALISRKSSFTFRKNSSKGMSLFLFNFTIMVVTLLLLAGLAFPYIYNFMKGNPVLSAGGIAYLVISIAIVLLCFVIIWIIYLFMKDFAVPYMYSKTVPALFALKQVWKHILEKKSEVFVYWIARLLLGIGIAIASVIIFIILLLPFIILGGIIFLIGLAIHGMTGALPVLIILGIVIGFFLLLALILAAMMATLPLTVFYRYFQLMNFEKLTSIKLLKKF